MLAFVIFVRWDIGLVTSGASKCIRVSMRRFGLDYQGLPADLDDGHSPGHDVYYETYCSTALRG